MNINGKTGVLAVIGCPIGHSLSPIMHNAAIKKLQLDYIYIPFHVEPGDILQAVEGFRALNIKGINVTIPHKEAIIPYLDEISDSARRIGSVNTIVCDEGRLYGESTDGIGFMRSAEDVFGDVQGKKVLLLGAGGSARAVSASLVKADCCLTIANRTVEKAIALKKMLEGVNSNKEINIVETRSGSFIQAVEQSELIVNTTSLGMFPHPENTPLPAQLIHPYHLVYDLVYNPLETRLTIEAKARGAKAVSGLKMLVYQGAASFEMWTGIFPPVDVMEQTLLAAIQSAY